MPTSMRCLRSYPVVIDQKLTSDIKMIFVQKSQSLKSDDAVSSPSRTKFLAALLHRMTIFSEIFVGMTPLAPLATPMSFCGLTACLHVPMVLWP